MPQAAAGSPCLACSGGSLRDRTGGLEVTAWAKLLVLLSSSSPYLGPAPSAKHHHRIPLGTPMVLQLLHPQAQPQCHIPASWGHLCHSGLLVPGERLTAQGIQTAERAGDPLGCTGAAWLWVLPGCFHPSSAPLGCTSHSGGAPSVSQPLGLLWQRGSSPTDANTVSVIPLQTCLNLIPFIKSTCLIERSVFMELTCKDELIPTPEV